MHMRVLAITPIHVGPEELARRQGRYDRLAPEGMSVTVVDLPVQAPTALATDADVQASDHLVAEVIARHDGEFDYVLPDCVLDPGVETKPASESERVVGLLEQAMVQVAATGERYGVIVRNQAIAKEMRRRLELYSLSGNLVDIHVLDLPFEAVTDHEMWNNAMNQGVRTLGESGASTVINGCSAVDLANEDLGVSVIDPTQAALTQIALAQN
jgi:Asp/Glu/hydantoin racemase